MNECCFAIILIFVIAGLIVWLMERRKKQVKKEMKDEAKRYLQYYKCAYCESLLTYNNETIPSKVKCQCCNCTVLLYRGTITIKKQIRYDYNKGKAIYTKKEFPALKTKEVSSGQNIEQNINIQDSVIQRSNIGAHPRMEVTPLSDKTEKNNKI